MSNEIELMCSYIGGFGRTDSNDVSNSIYVAKTLLNLEITSKKFREQGRYGVGADDITLTIGYIERNIRNDEHFILKRLEKENENEFKIGEMMSKYNSKQLALMALFLWNNGKSTLYPDERKEAENLLKKDFSYEKAVLT